MPTVPVTSLGECQVPSPILARHLADDLRVPDQIHWRGGRPPEDPDLFEQAGPRSRLFFEPEQTRAAIVTCGGLCPGLNNVIRSLVLQLYHGYGVREVLGFRDGYRGLDPRSGVEPLPLTLERVHDIHKQGGTILGTSRGPVNVAAAVDELLRRGVNVLFTIGGDGTQRGGHALFEEARRRGHALSVVGVPKTIDNDVPFVTRSFGYLTALEQACLVLDRAHTEARSVHNGIALVRLMGRSAGFIAGGATMASQDVNFCLIPEVPFALDGSGGFLSALRRRVVERAHAVVVVAEGAGQELIAGSEGARDASGNPRLKDVGVFLRERIEAYFRSERLPVVMRYFDPGYLIRSCPANAEDAVLCDLFARHAVHAAMAGKTGLVIGLLHDRYVHVPIELLNSRRKQIDPDDQSWQAVLACTGQPARFE
ncbi:MAG TPA: ATP-dependent 6-phosphofructokinase [Anaeromyxobacter sp.]|nr:ATP-dependent 6-phosphofructokinase [Anaeromyxobacter sp.]